MCIYRYYFIYIRFMFCQLIYCFGVFIYVNYITNNVLSHLSILFTSVPHCIKYFIVSIFIYSDNIVSSGMYSSLSLSFVFAHCSNKCITISVYPHFDMNTRCISSHCYHINWCLHYVLLNIILYQVVLILTLLL